MKNRIKQIIKEQGINQSRLAGLTGIERSYMSKITKGLNPPNLNKAHRIAHALGKRIENVFIFEG